MAYIETISKADAQGVVKELYDEAEASNGYIPNYLQLFSHRPEVYKLWMSLIATIRQSMTLRRYELVTLAAARTLQGTYCMMAHGDAFLNSNEVTATQLIAIAKDYHNADLSEEEVAIMEFAEKIIVKSCVISQVDVDHLKSFGISDAEILDITLAAAARSFFSKTLDALNTEPDAKFMNLHENLRDSLAVGRPFGAKEKV
jgi:uncharacterized peroxidase-related enzyme